MANSYKKARVKDLYLAHGYVSSGVSALLAASSLALAASRFLYEAASSAQMYPEKGVIGMAQLLKMASSLSDSSRQNELAAWELCAREAVIYKRNRVNSDAAPWLVQAQNYSAAGKERRPRGRPRKDQAHTMGQAGQILQTEPEKSDIDGHRSTILSLPALAPSGATETDSA
jgi:hypothetical protein